MYVVATNVQLQDSYHRQCNFIRHNTLRSIANLLEVTWTSLQSPACDKPCLLLTA
jgi:hypothetical protein